MVELYSVVAIALDLDIDLIFTPMNSFVYFLVLFGDITETSILNGNFGFLCIVAVRIGKLCAAANGFACIIPIIIFNILRKLNQFCIVIDLKLHLTVSHFCRVDLPCGLSNAGIVALALDLYGLLANSSALYRAAYGVVGVGGESETRTVFYRHVGDCQLST